jgi:hypothetical protein
MTRPSQHELWAEAAELATRLGWSLDAILDLEHHDRRRLIAAARDVAAAAAMGAE